MKLIRRILCWFDHHRYIAVSAHPLHHRNGRLPPLRYACRDCGKYKRI